MNPTSYEHPTKEIIGDKGTELEGKKIVLCVTGSVAAIKSPEIARTLMRHGAEVRVAMSESATELVTSELMHWATGNSVVSRLMGGVEHVDLGQWADIVLVAPCTANTIGKIATGLGDTPPTATVTVAQGLEKPIALVPAMHGPMYTYSVTQKNLELLRDMGVRVLEPKFEEGKAKIPPVGEILDFIISLALPTDLMDKRILVTAGPTIERLDPVRYLTNPSSGKMGISIARVASARGAEVTLVYGPGREPEPFGVKTIRVETTEDMMDVIEKELDDDYDVIVAAAAPQDFRPEESSDRKIRREGPLDVKLVPTKGVLDKAVELAPDAFVVGFKAESDVSDEELKERGKEKMDQLDLDLVVANDIMRPGAGFESDTNDVFLMTPSETTHLKGTKTEIANSILDAFVALR